MKETYECNFCTVDTTQFPIVIFTLTGIDPTIEEVAEFKKLRNEVYSHVNEKTIIVADGTKGAWINSTARIQMGKDQKEFSAEYRHVLTMSVMVMPNALAKMMLRGINILSKPALPQKIVSSLEEAMEIAKNALKTA